MRTKALLVALLLASSSPLLAQDRVEIRTLHAAEIAHILERQGFALVEGSIDIDSFELIVPAQEQRLLELRGLKPILLQEGRPCKDIQAERMAETPAAYAGGGYKNYQDVQGNLSLMSSLASQNGSMDICYLRINRV